MNGPTTTNPKITPAGAAWVDITNDGRRDLITFDRIVRNAGTANETIYYGVRDVFLQGRGGELVAAVPTDANPFWRTTRSVLVGNQEYRVGEKAPSYPKLGPITDIKIGFADYFLPDGTSNCIEGINTVTMTTAEGDRFSRRTDIVDLALTICVQKNVEGEATFTVERGTVTTYRPQ